jgi:hypothetical protein
MVLVFGSTRGMKRAVLSLTRLLTASKCREAIAASLRQARVVLPASTIGDVVVASLDGVSTH